MIGRLPRLWKKAILPIDTRERHQLVAAALHDVTTVLDVGGRRGELCAFLPGSRVMAVNTGASGDVVYDGDTLPFATDSFDAVASLDVLEHIPSERRRQHVEELVRVARERVVLCCPLGTPEHVAAERELAALHPHRFLDEHLANGLPTEQELDDLVAGLPFSFEISFHGDFRRTIRMFRLGRKARRGKPRAVASYARELLRGRDMELLNEPTPWTNRGFLFGRRG
jgi:SAM-dependent methyltransferase